MKYASRVLRNVAVSGIILLPLSLSAQHSGSPMLPRITQRIDENKLVSLSGNTRPAANAANDQGRVPDELLMEHTLLLLQRSPEQEQELETFISELHNPASPNFHQWLTLQEFGSKYGVAQSDLETVTNWLESHGFAINQVYPNRILIDFTGTAKQIREAFHTEMHGYAVNGAPHVANASDPQIPAALAGVVQGIVSLNDFRPRPQRTARPQYTFTSGSATYYALVPGDLATIYNFPAFSSTTAGQGQTIVVIEDTDVYSTNDWSTFVSTFGLSGYGGSFSQVHPGCSDPGYNGDDGEAILDAEWATAAAPGAHVELASCADTRSTFGGLIAFQNLINSANAPTIYSISYGECEAANGATANAAYNSAYQQAVSQGFSVFVASGDEGAASCDADLSNATHGIGVSGFASTPYNVAVGGTDFSDTYSKTNTTYWNSSSSSANYYASAKSYIPEIPWNDSCAGSLLAQTFGYSTSYGSGGFCNSSTARQDGFITTAAGSGGPSGCATGSPARGENEIVSGTCKGYTKPSWQNALTPADNVRDLPDVSLFAANGIWAHYYVFCWSDPSERNSGSAPCTGAPSGWSGAGGTSFASPIMAGVQALINQKKGAKQGNPNARYYALAASNYNTVFHDVTMGDMSVNCTGSFNCYGTSGRSYGVLSTSSSSLSRAYAAKSGWDFATGLGSVNVANLINSW